MSETAAQSPDWPCASQERMNRCGNIKMMSKNSNLRLRYFEICFLCAVFLSGVPSFAQSTDATAYWAIPLPAKYSTNAPSINRYGVPFIQDRLTVGQNRPARVEVD